MAASPSCCTTSPMAAPASAILAAPVSLANEPRLAKPHFVGAAVHGRALVDSCVGRRSLSTSLHMHKPAANPAVMIRCMAWPSFTSEKIKLNTSSQQLTDLIASVHILKEGAFDVVSHTLHELLGNKIKLNTGSQQPTDLIASVHILKEGAFDVASHTLDELLGKKVKMYLVSLDVDPETKQGKISPAADLKFNAAGSTDKGKDSFITVRFPVAKDFGKPGAILVDSYHANEFFLKSVTLEMPDATAIHFPCNSWIVESKHNFGKPRVFFTNQAFLPKATPDALVKLREEDLVSLRGDGTGQRKSGERIYDYDVYNDLGNPDKGKDYARTVLGGSADYPYPRRCRTGRKHTKADPTSEEPALFDAAYIPRDERFSPLKKEMFFAASLRCFGHDVRPVLENLLTENKPFDLLEEIHDLYVGDLRSVQTSAVLRNPRDGTVISFPPPGVVQANKESWGSDQEFARQRLAGANPLCIQQLQEFPMVSKLDPEEYGQAISSITAQHIEPYLEGLTVEEAIKNKRLYILDYHDAIMPYVNKINEGAGKVYASRTIFFLSKVDVLLPVAIELSLPPKNKGEKAVSRVFTPAPLGLPDWEWRLAKTHVSVLDGGIHQLVSHWLRTHACVEPFIIASHRHLSTMHPLYALLSPHFKDTMNINSLARTSLIKAGGIIELAFTPGEYSIEISSVMYKGWRFDEQALPKDLVKRGVAEEDPSAKHGVKLVFEDYPFAADGLELWGAINKWVRDYVGIYYKDDKTLQEDAELQSWWKEIKEVGHGDHAGAAWWPEMKKVVELVEAVTTLIWVASGHHAAVNFGQYAYSGFMPNSPTMCKRLIPEEGTAEYTELLRDPEKFYLKMVSSQGQTTLVMATVEVLAQHMGEEEYLGQRSDPRWTSDPRALEAFESFRQALDGVEAQTEQRNASVATLHHRSGPVLLPYTLLAPSSGEGLTFRGVPNSISI